MPGCDGVEVLRRNNLVVHHDVKYVVLVLVARITAVQRHRLVRQHFHRVTKRSAPGRGAEGFPLARR